MNVTVEATSGNDVMLASNDVRAISNDHIRMNTIHDVRIACFTDSYNQTILDANICFVDAGPINDKRVEAVKGCRKIGKKDMKFNETMPKMKVDPENYKVEADGVHCTAEPAEKLPLTQAYFVY